MKRIKLLLFVHILVLTIILTGCSSASSKPAQSSTTQTPGTSIVADAAKAYFANMPADIYKIAEKDFVDKVKANEAMFIIDIRQAADYDQGHIMGAVNIPWGEAIAQKLSNLPKDKAIMVYCYTGQTAGQTVALLNVAGFKAKSVNLGWNLGISKVEGVAGVTETKANPVPEGKTQVAPEIQKAITDYFDKMTALNGTTYANYKISEDNAKAVLDTKDPSVMFLSVRKAEDFDKGHIPGAINLPFAKGMQAYFGPLLPTDKKIIVYCYTGQTAGQTVAILRLLGYDAVSLNSGMGTEATPGTGWVNKGFPVVGDAGASGPAQGTSTPSQSTPTNQPQPSAGDHS
ncbi:MAG: rhodanese-like domain-containing protein [Peptococcaceae bacterium]|nr:rhodanese-like domain-containing protein [Peptococcaceae bacterium]